MKIRFRTDPKGEWVEANNIEYVVITDDEDKPLHVFRRRGNYTYYLFLSTVDQMVESLSKAL